MLGTVLGLGILPVAALGALEAASPGVLVAMIQAAAHVALAVQAGLLPALAAAVAGS